ncbi:hypothetical protein KEM48_004273 [Puccinia striiformis f. sp. tritici PST-130]|nr:hypothetical protein KEM48_004273 [Puccinia striiformis f. sp. tritici PST-130]
MFLPRSSSSIATVKAPGGTPSSLTTATVDGLGKVLEFRPPLAWLLAGKAFPATKAGSILNLVSTGLFVGSTAVFTAALAVLLVGQKILSNKSATPLSVVLFALVCPVGILKWC